MYPPLVDRTLQEANEGKKESQYFYALMKLYGDGVDKDVKGGECVCRWLSWARRYVFKAANGTSFF